jgi:hypothetical protein
MSNHLDDRYTSHQDCSIFHLNSIECEGVYVEQETNLEWIQRLNQPIDHAKFENHYFVMNLVTRMQYRLTWTLIDWYDR